MDYELIDTGRIINTHGIRGEVKIEPWADSPQALLEYDSFFIDGDEYRVERSRVHKGFVIAALGGVDTVERAEALRGKLICIPRSQVPIQDGGYLLRDLVGLEALDDKTGGSLGKITDILELPGGNVCEIRGGREILVPLRPEFVTEVNVDGGYVRFSLIEGM